MNAQINYIQDDILCLRDSEHEGIFTLREGCLNDDTLHLAPIGYQYRGGYIAVIKHYTFRNTQSNNEHIVRFKSVNSLAKYLVKHYPEFEF
jgi:hypothetical protein